MDHQFQSDTDTDVSITRDRVCGRGVAEDTLALAVLITLPDILKRLGIVFNHDIELLASTRSHGRGDYEGLRTFIDKYKKGIDFVVNLDAVPLGKVNYFSLSRVRCDINCELSEHESSPWRNVGSTNAIMVILQNSFAIFLPPCVFY